MENLRNRSEITAGILILMTCCFLMGCAQTPQRQGHTGLPVRIGIQGEEPLPVKLQLGPNDKLPVALVFENGQVLPVEAKLQVDDKIPVELVVKENKALPVDANIKADYALSVKVIPDRAIWIGIAIAGLIAFFTMVAAVASCHAAINARRAAEKQGK
jgi:hypothetical protein